MRKICSDNRDHLFFRYFLRYFSSTHRTDLSRFRGTFHSFDPVGFAIFAMTYKSDPPRPKQVVGCTPDSLRVRNAFLACLIPATHPPKVDSSTLQSPSLPSLWRS